MNGPAQCKVARPITLFSDAEIMLCYGIKQYNVYSCLSYIVQAYRYEPNPSLSHRVIDVIYILIELFILLSV